MQGKLFAQSRLGRDYFKECRVELTQDGQLLVDVQSGRQEDEREFNRGLDLALFDEHVRVTSKRRDNGEDLYIIKLTLAEGLQAMRLATESPQTARRWQLELQNALREARACSRVWACLRRDGVGANLLHEIETLSRVELYAVCQASRHHTFLLHEVCRALPAPCFAPSGMEPHEGSDACYRIGREVVSVLIEHGANIVHTRNGAGHLPVHVLLDACSGSCADSELTHDVLQRLLELNADGVQARADFVKRGSVYMPVHLACAALAPALVQVVVGMDNPSRRLDAFLGEAPHLLQQTARGETPLHIVTAALSRSDLDADAIARARHLCALLVSLEPEALLAVDGDGETPLHKVSRAADLEVLRVFLDSALQRTTQAASLRNNAGQSCVDLLLENQRRFACAGERDRLIPVERCVALFRIGPSATKLFSSSS